jgi:hypothetical protein
MKWIGAWVIVLICVVGIQKAEAVHKILGLSSECDTTNTGCVPIPLVLTTLCTASCPYVSQPSLTDANRFWGSLAGSTCNTSTNGGVTWVGCTTQPPAFTPNGLRETYAGAADGSVIGAAQNVGTGACEIVRSVDNGANWTTVFTKASRSCSPGNEGTLLKCRIDGKCILPFLDGGTGVCYTYVSTDNGQSWAEGTGVATCNASPVNSSWNGTLGIVQPQANGGVSHAWFTVDGSTWNKSTAWAAAVGSCWGGVIYNGAGHGICFSSVNYTLRDTAGTLELNMTLPGVTALINAGGLGYSLGSNNLYVLATWTPVSGTSPIGVWLTRDGSTFTLIGTSSVLANSMRGGDFYAGINGCLYFSAGVNPIFGKIC